MKEDLSFDFPKNKASKIKVIGVGGGGNNAVNYMYNQGIIGVDFVVCNTDAQALESSPVPTKIQLGISITEGLGAGANPEIGEQAAIETIEKIKEILETNTKMVFITAGMGGGTGTGAAPIIAKCARDLGILTVGIVTVPFKFEGEKRYEHAQIGLEKLRQNVDSLIVINNNKLRELYGNLGYKAGFAKSDEILANAAKGIAEIITQNYQVNIDLMDVKKVLADSGTAIMGSATAEGPNRAQDAITKALDSPLLNDNKITGAKNVLLLIVSGKNEITMDEIATINEYIQTEAGNNAHIIMGIGEDQQEEDKINVMVVATGFKQDNFLTNTPIKRNLNDTVNLDYKSNINNENKNNQDKNNKVRYILDDEEEKKNLISNKNINSLFDSIDENTEFSIKKEPEFITKISNSTFEEKKEKKNIIIQKEIEIINDENINKEHVESKSYTPLSDENNIQRTIQERREKLKSFNTQYHSEKLLNELEKTPAFVRNGIQLDFNSLNSTDSKYFLDTKTGDIKPNNFLNKNID